MQKTIELLAPAGRWDVLEAVISAGADAVYLGSKKFNMRMHRSDYHFTDEQLISAVKLAHKHGVKIYITVNNLLSDTEIDEVRLFLEFLQEIGVDAIIVQDLGILHLTRQMKLEIDIHSSTMMNTHSVPMAMELKEMGINRIIVSRDITIAQAKEIHEKCDIEVEYFVHGDMCSAQSSQCYSSGVLFGKSSNRGECMKPCRWKYSLVDQETGRHLGGVNEGHFLAMNDLCLLQHIPSLAQAGVCSFKIEGRMRDAKFLREVVSIYRRAIDSYLDAPSFYYPDVNDIETIYKSRVRNLSTSVSFTMAQTNTFDYSGNREPLFLSKFAKEESLTESDLEDNPFIDCGLGIEDFGLKATNDVHCKSTLNRGRSTINNKSTATTFAETACVGYDSNLDLKNHGLDDHRFCESINDFQSTMPRDKTLAVKIGSLGALKAAIASGADYAYINGEVSPIRGQKWTIGSIREAIEITHGMGKMIGLCSPRITNEREIGDVKCLLEKVRNFGVDSLLVHNLGTLRLAREFGFNIIADFSFNILNTYNASMLMSIGASKVTLSIESSFDNLCEITSSSDIDIECIVHGQIPFMILEHCLPAIIVTNSNANGVCRQPCRHMNYALKDEKGEIRPIEVDQYCRNHIFFASDLCILPYISSFMKTEINSLRIEAQYYNEDIVGTIVKLYRKQMDIFDNDSYDDYTLSGDDWNELVAKSPRKFNLGAYKHNIFQSKKTVDVIRSLNL
ncbi:MAG: peptidase U32 family protein [Candidatus Anammoxibacter sp.]